MDFPSLPHFCRKRGSSKNLDIYTDNCFSLDHPFHKDLYNYIKQQFRAQKPTEPLKQGSVHVTLPEDASEDDIAKVLESLEKLKALERGPDSFKGLKINDDKY